ncbi:MAG: hypothetical protein V5B44_00095 [Candidatus Accumulibacter necessarius]|uniref:hypothetical protein n=1 Tax=Candidatus Accumulibacter necessarius TaxID=2954386 RepID=UPI002FC34F1C
MIATGSRAQRLNGPVAPASHSPESITALSSRTASRTIGQRFGEDDPALMIAGAGLDQPGQFKTGQPLQRYLGAQVIEHQEMAGGKLRLARLE